MIPNSSKKEKPRRGSSVPGDPRPPKLPKEKSARILATLPATQKIPKRFRGLGRNKLGSSFGRIISVKDGVAFVSGLKDIKVGEMVEFVNKGLTGMALNLESEQVGCIIFGDDTTIKQDDTVRAMKTLVQTPVGYDLLGRVVDGIGNFIDGGVAINFDNYLNVERKAPGVITRESVTEPMLTGYKIIDSMLPIGRGQRELIVGDRQTGKTTIAIDTILNQRFTNLEDIDLYCVYVGIGQKKSSILNIQTLLQKNEASHYTTIVAATAAQSASLQFIAPYTGCAIAEFYRDRGEHALIIYDDLTKHAAAYRQLSLLLRRPPGREAFPGDVFYAHSRLLERACKLNSDFGGGSLTALPIVETQAGDLSGYIPTNVISITDGQIFMEKDLFFKGIRPAVNVGSSVSRVGSKAQPYALRLVTGNLRYQLAQYREYQVFAQFDNDIDDVTRGILNKGALLTEILKQGPNVPMQLYNQVLIILAGAFNYIAPFVKDFKKDLNKICSLYETRLFKFTHETEERQEFFYPFYDLLSLAEKSDFGFNDNPLVFVLKSFEPSFYKALNS
jgi:proton translocating ATP synthase F1 alpha subunit